MKKSLLFLIVSLNVIAYSQSTFPRGVYLFQHQDVDLRQMRDSLHINWVQGPAQDQNGVTRPILDSAGALNVNFMGMMLQHSYDYSRGQHMEFEAEQVSDPLKNYFSETPSGEPDGIFLSSSGSAGYMVQGAVPGKEYHYNQTNYNASYIMKILKNQSGNPDVAYLIVRCCTHNADLAKDTVRYNDFTTTAPETIDVPFSLQSHIVTPPPYKDLSMLLGTHHAYAGTTCDSIDIRVYWCGNVTTWLDKVIVEDEIGKNLFAGNYDTNINTEVDAVKTKSGMKRFYQVDEPEMSAFLTHKRMRDKMYNRVGSGIESITATFKSFDRFIIDAQPNELMIFQYPITADIPSPSMTSTQASDVGIAAFTTVDGYESGIQSAVVNLINYGLKPGILAATASTPRKPFWFTPQLHGIYAKSIYGYRNVGAGINKLRPPTANEVTMMCNMALAYGANGIIAFPFANHYGKEGSDSIFIDGIVSPVTVSGKYKNHWTNTMPIPFAGASYSTVYTGFNEKWDALSAVYRKLDSLGSVWQSLTWQGTKSWNNAGTVGTWNSFVTAVDAKIGGVSDNLDYVETGHFTIGADNYIFVVNRRTHPTETRDITIWINSTESKEIFDVASGKIWIIAPNGAFTDTFTPGEGKLYKISPATWNGTKLLSNTATVLNGAVLTISGNTEIKLSTITFNAGSTVKVSSGSSLTIKNNCQINGTSGSRVTFTSVSGSTAGSWGNLIFNNCASSTVVNYAKVQYGNEVQILNDANITFQNSQILNCVEGIYFYNCEPLIQNNTITDVYQNGIIGNADGYFPQLYGNIITKSTGNPYYRNYSGINLGSSTIGYITQNDINGYDYGMYLGGGVTSYFSDYSYYVPVKNNRVTGNNSGVVVGWGSYVNASWDIGLNSIYSNSYYAAYVYQYSSFYAWYNWWGGTTPSVYVDGTSYPQQSALAQSPYPYDPWNPPGGGEEWVMGNDKPKNKFEAATQTIDNETEQISVSLSQTLSSYRESNSEIQTGLALQKEGRYQEAITLYKDLIEQEKFTRVAIAELTKLALSGNVESSKKLEIRSYFESLKQTKKFAELPFVYQSVAAIKNRLGEKQTLLTSFDEIGQRFSNTHFERQVKFQKLYALIHQEMDFSAASTLLTEIRTKYENSEDKMILQEVEFAEQQLQFNQDLNSNSSSLQNQAFQKKNSITSKRLITEYKLFDNYPNPFNPTTTISYDLPSDTHVKLFIFDILGRNVETLVNEFKSSGNYKVEFDAKDLSSGIYFYHLQTSGFNQTKKFVLMR